MTMVNSVIVRLTAVCLLVYSADADPTVALSHGGQLRGVSTTFLESTVDLFLGVRYAQPPVGKLRFKKPQEVEGWQGVKDAKLSKSICPQLSSLTQKYIGDEDCLFMDITVPGGVQPGAKKAVMVWIHGGGYMIGSGVPYIGAALATTGDVIVVSINYRLGILGFLALEKGTGNYGLWDQRAALLWIKQNIEQFGGDPDRVTIFGESAGASSASAQTIGQHNDGLFKRAILQSGAIFGLFDQSDNMRYKWEQSLREENSCPVDKHVFECLESKTAEEIITQTKILGQLPPVADGDFFSEETSNNENYELSRRFDLMAGFNGQEGGLLYTMEIAMYARVQNKSIEDGIDMELVRDSLNIKCLTQITPLSSELCSSWAIDTYDIDEAADDKDRALRLVEFLGEISFNEDAVRQLEEHSTGDTLTYAYYFTEEHKPDPPNPLWTAPDWLKKKADHGDELPFVFGGASIVADMKTNNIWKKMLDMDELMEPFLKGINKNNRKLSVDMMKMWTNFANSGNPNQPTAISETIPTFPEFTADSNQFLEINSKNMQVITTPHKDRLHKIRNDLMTARKKQKEADKRPNETGQGISGCSKTRDEL